MATVADLDLKNLLDTATFLNNRLKIGNDTAHITEEINKSENNKVQEKLK